MFTSSPTPILRLVAPPPRLCFARCLRRWKALNEAFPTNPRLSQKKTYTFASNQVIRGNWDTMAPIPRYVVVCPWNSAFGLLIGT